MKLIFVDDSRQLNPTRDRVGPLVALGGLMIDAEMVRDTENNLDQLCKDHGFPDGEIFKWSPQKSHWMREGLVDSDRTNFQLAIVDILQRASAKLFFVCEDTSCSKANADSISHEFDVFRLLIERVDWCLRLNDEMGIMIVDRPGGDYRAEERFLLQCAEHLKLGTKWLKPDRIILSILSSPSSLIRLLQCADLVTSSTLSLVSGEDRWSPPVVEKLRPLFFKESMRIGGAGVKLHPWKKFVNLYHWLFGDAVCKTGNDGWPLPLSNYAFPSNSKDYYAQ